MFQYLDRDLRIRQWNGCACPNPARILVLCARHLLVPGYCSITTLLRWQVRKIDREGTKRADNAHLMAKPIQMLQLPVEVEPLSPRIDGRSSFVSQVVVSAAAVPFRTRKAAAHAKLLEDLSRPPVEMGIDDPHAPRA